VTVALTCIEKQRISYQAISLTHFADTAEPQIAAGSLCEIGGALYEFAANESITDWAAIAVSSAVYIKLVAAGASVTAAFTTTAPTWNTTLQGWYSGTDRYIGGLYKDAGGNYTKKWFYEEKQGLWLKRYGDGTIELLGAVTIAGALTLAGALSGVTSLTMAGALSGVTSLTMAGALSGVTSLGMLWSLGAGSQAVASPTPYYPPAGLYLLAQLPANAQVYINAGGWKLSHTAGQGGVIVADGTNVYFWSTAGSVTFNWLKLA
jgi:hypothetical protein